MQSKPVAWVKSSSRSTFSLRFFILATSLLVSFVSFAFVLAVSSIVYMDTIEHNAKRFASEEAQQFYHSIPFLMGKGWSRSELLSLYNAQQQADSRPTHSIQLYRTSLVEDRYGKGELPDEDVIESCRTGCVVEKKRDHYVDTVYPLVASKPCFRCHENARDGAILGALKVRQNIRPMVHEARNRLISLFFLLSPIPILMAIFIARLVNGRVTGAINLLGDKVIDVNSMRDLTTLELSDIRPGFTELDRIFGEIDKLVGKIRTVSVDKEIMELEIQMLEKFIITSEVIRDWKEHVSSLLLEINQVVDAYLLFCIFQVDEELYDIEIFWKSTPSEATKQRVVEEVLARIRQENSRLALLSTLHVVHNIASADSPPLDMGEGDIDLQTKSLILESPQIGGVVGIGVQAESGWSSTRSLVIDSILTTLLNVVGSIKAIHKYTKDLEYYATRDPLTNLFNQRAFWELIVYEVGRAERHDYTFGLLVIDLDNFKNINDTWGHSTGDRYLSAFAARTQEVLRKGDIFARYGGDEFVIVLPEADETQVYMIAGRIKEITEELFVTAPDGSKAKATTSIGMAIFPHHARNEKDLFLFADNMTYKAKSEGKNRVILPTDEDVLEVFRRAGEKARLVMEAVDQRQVIPYFQPIVPLRPGMAECRELLCRIEQDGRIIAAGDFIEAAESLGIVGKLDSILMDKAFAMVRDEGYEGSLFVNLSPKSMIMAEFLPGIIGLADKYGIEHSRIVFELTERETVRNLSLLEKFVHELKSLGFKFAIDDFGSGFSSFQYIRQFPIDFVKIEGVFVRNMLKDYKDMAFVKTLAILAREFNISTIAEYIEDESILQAVREVGIDYAQGFHVGRPAPTLGNRS